MPHCFERTLDVAQYDCDPWDRMTPGAVLRWAQVVSTEHCESLGIDDALYRRTHTVFLLSRVSLVTEKMPRRGQQVLMKTRAYGMKRAVYHRLTSFHDENGEKMCEVDGHWVLVDTESWRILRKPLDEFLPYFNEPPAEEHSFDYPQPGSLLPLAELVAGYSLCDRNMHVNNARYADIICDHLPLEKLAEGPPRRMLLFYRSEVRLGEGFSLAGAPAGEDGYCFLAESEGKKHFEGYAGF